MLITSVIIHIKIRGDSKMSFILNFIYKEKDDARSRGNYRGLNLTEHVMKFMERIEDELIREIIVIHEMQLDFVLGEMLTWEKPLNEYLVL